MPAVPGGSPDPAGNQTVEVIAIDFFTPDRSARSWLMLQFPVKAGRHRIDVIHFLQGGAGSFLGPKFTEFPDETVYDRVSLVSPELAKFPDEAVNNRVCSREG